MATLTQTVEKPFAQPSRTYDYLYDTNFMVSGARDHARESYKAHTSFERLRYVPHFKTMFSSLRHYPRQGITLDTTDPVPRHVPRHWRGYADHARESLIRYKKFNYDPTVRVPPQAYEKAEVDGRNRYRYFRRPIIPFLPQMPPSVVLATTRVDPLAQPSDTAPGVDLSEPQTRSVHVQTDFRDSEAQTDPYSPDYIVRPGSQPELLTLATLSYGRGLPAGLAEVEMIERARAKRAWEATLPPLSDLGQLERRGRMMEAQERKEWAFRESEIERLQHERLSVVERMLRQREVDHQALNARRLEHLWSKKLAEKDRHVRRLHSNHVQALRKLTNRCRHVERKLERQNIIQQYTNFDSQVYAPMTRTGVYPDSGSDRFNVKNRFTSTLDGLLELEATLPSYVTQPRVRAPNPLTKPVGVRARQRAKLGNILAQVHTDLVKERTSGPHSPQPLRLLQQVEKPVPRPPTPSVAGPPAAEEEEELAVILLQRVLRGRAIQNKMFEVKENRRDLIAELRTTHALQSPEQQQKRTEAEDIRSQQQQARASQHQADVVGDGTEGGAALALGHELDLLNKELRRLQEERRVHAMVMLGERGRRRREAEESGRRQREERLRRIQDETFKQMMRVQQGSVESYLEDIILQSVERTGDQQAREEVQRQVAIINTIAHDFQHTELSGRELVAEMVYSFLLPEVERQALREKVHRHQRRHLLAAHRAVHGRVEDVLGEEQRGEEEQRKD